MTTFTDQELTKIYNEANNIGEGKSPPISTEKIFTAMRYIANYHKPNFGDENHPNPCSEIVLEVKKPKCCVGGTTENVTWIGGSSPWKCPSPDCVAF